MTTANDLIETIAGNMTEVNKPLKTILATLEDGEALVYLGVTDEDQEAVEDAHDVIKTMLQAGKVTL